MGKGKRRVKADAGNLRLQVNAPQARSLVARWLAVCGAVATTAKAVEGAAYLYKLIWPHLQELGGFLFPERFWFDGLKRATRDRPARAIARIASASRAARLNRRELEERVAGFPASALETSARVAREVENLIRRVPVPDPALPVSKRRSMRSGRG